MKKLAFLTVVVGLAMGAQAEATWYIPAGEKQKNGAIYSDGSSNPLNGTMYYFLASQVSIDQIKNIGDNTGYLGFTQLVQDGKGVSAAIKNGVVSSVNGSVDVLDNNSSIYLAIYDRGTDKYWVCPNRAGKTDKDGYNLYMTLWTESARGAKFVNDSTAGWANAPEPTSGLLLLLGVAGLALKRKRA